MNAGKDAQSDHSLSSSSESSSESLYSTAIRRDRMVATSFPTGSRLLCCSCCSWTFLSWMPTGVMKKMKRTAKLTGLFLTESPSSCVAHLCGWQRAGHYGRLSRASSQPRLLRHDPLGPRLAGAVPVAEVLEEEGACVGQEGAQVAAGSPGPRANPHCAVSVAVPPNENQRPSGWMGWVGRGQAAGRLRCLTAGERGLRFDGNTFHSHQIMQATNKHTCNPQVDVLSRWVGGQREALPPPRTTPSCS